MAGRFFDFQAHYNTAYMYAKYTHPGGAIDPSPPPGRLGPKINLTFASIAKSLVHRDHWVVGIARWVGTNFTFGDIYSAGHNDAPIIRLRLLGDGTISAFAGSSTAPSAQIFNSSPFSIHGSEWNYFELKWDMSGSSNILVTASMHVNGTLRGSGSASSGVNVVNLLNQTCTANAHGFGGDSTAQCWGGDIYIFDGDVINVGNPNNDFAGDLTGLLVVPNGDVSSTWSGASPQFQLINENPPDGDGSFISAKDVGDLALFDFQNIPAFSGTIVSAHRCTLARKDAEGSKSFKHTIGSTNSGDEFFVNDNYVYYTEPMDVDPNTGLAWTQSGFNAAQFGNRIIS